MKKLHTAMSMRQAAFAATLFAGLGASCAIAQGYNPSATSPVNGNAALTFVEIELDKLGGTVNDGVGPSMIVPTPAGRTLATEEELDTALGNAVAGEIGGTNPFAGGTVLDLVREVSKYRSGKVSKMILQATDQALLLSANDAARESNLEQVAQGAAEGNLKDASKVVDVMLKKVAGETAATLQSDDSDDIVTAAIVAAEGYADKITSTAMKAVQKAPLADVPAIMQSIAKAAVFTVSSEGARYLLDEVTKAVALNTKALTTNASLVGAIWSAGTPLSNAEDTALAMGGLMAGGAKNPGEDTIATAIATAVKGVGVATTGASDAYINAVLDGFNDANGSTDAAAVAGAIGTLAGAANANQIAAYVTGVGAWSPKAVELFIDDAVKKAGASTESVTDIMRAGVRANQKDVAKAAITAIGVTDAQSGETGTRGHVMQGVGEGLKGNPLYAVYASAAMEKAIKTLGATGATLREMVGGGVDGVEVAGELSSIAQVTFIAAKTSKSPADVVIGAFGAFAGEHVAAGEQWRAVLGSMAADKKNAASIRTAAKLLGSYDAGNNSEVTKGGDVLINSLGNNKNVYNFLLDGLTELGVSDMANSASDVESILTGAGLVTPKDAITIGAAALRYSTLPAATIRGLAISFGAKSAQKTNIGLDVAERVLAPGGTTDLYDYLDHLMFKNPKFPIEIARGATAAVPQFANVVAGSLAYRSPFKAGKIATEVFRLAQLDNHIANVTSPDHVDNPADAAAAITAALTNGILQANVDPALLSGVLTGTITAAVKGSLDLSKVSLAGNGAEGMNLFRQANGAGTDPTNPANYSSTNQKAVAGVVAGYLTLELVPADVTGLPEIAKAVITAAAGAAKAYGMEMAQAAGVAARAVIGIGVVAGGQVAQDIAAALLAGGASGNLLNAVDFGIRQFTEAVGVHQMGAGAGGVVQYTQAVGSGAYVTSIFNL